MEVLVSGSGSGFDLERTGSCCLVDRHKGCLEQYRHSLVIGVNAVEVHYSKLVVVVGQAVSEL